MSSLVGRSGGLRFPILGKCCGGCPVVTGIALLTGLALVPPAPAGPIQDVGSAASAQGSSDDDRFHLASERIPLRDLIDELARRSGLALDFGGREVKGVIELTADGRGVTLRQLWRSVNEQLAATGLALVQRPDHDVLSLVALGEAAGLARVEPLGVAGSRAGYVRVLHRTRSMAPRQLATALGEVLPRERAAVTALETAGHLVVAGLRADVEQAIAILELLDGPATTFDIAQVPVVHGTPAAIAARLEQLAQKQVAAGARPGVWFLPLPEAASVLIGAPATELERWRGWTERFDSGSALVTRHYTPRRHAARDVAVLIGEVVGSGGGAGGAGGAGSRGQGSPGREPHGWRLVHDTLTGTLLVTADEGTHAAIAALVERLEAAEGAELMELRSFPLRFRSAKEVLERLQRLLDLEGGLEELARGAGDAPAPEKAGLSGRGLRLAVDEGTNRVLAHGEPRLLRQLGELLGDLDTHEPEVLIEAVLVTLTGSEAQSLGVELRAGGQRGGALFEAASLFDLASPGLSGPSPGPLAGLGGVAAVLDPGDFSAVLRALESVRQGRALARPRLVARNHARAQLDSVLESPYAATVSTDVIATTTFGGSTQAGTQVSVIPHLIGGDRLRLEYTISVSTFVGEAADPALPPPRQETVLRSEATVPDGHTVILGGIEIENRGEGETATPLLGKLPLLGWLFRDRSQSRERTRFFVFLRCDVLRSESFLGLRHLSSDAATAAELLGDAPDLEPRWMR